MNLIKKTDLKACFFDPRSIGVALKQISPKTVVMKEIH